MEFLAGLLVAKPFNILAVAMVILVIAIAYRRKNQKTGKSAHPIGIACAAWLLYAGWEWLVLVKTPEADMRVDLLLIWPIVGVLSLWAAYKLFR